MHQPFSSIWNLPLSANSSAIIDWLRRRIINTMSCLPLSWINSKRVIIPSGCCSFHHFLLFDYYYLLYPCSGSSWCDALPGISCFLSLNLRLQFQFVIFIYSLRQILRPLQQLLVNLKYFHKCPHHACKFFGVHQPGGMFAYTCYTDSLVLCPVSPFSRS